MQQHALEFSQTLIPSFNIKAPSGEATNSLSAFELSMLCGCMVHPASTFSVDIEGNSLSIEWVQEYPI
jgi:hypothetical protein